MKNITINCKTALFGHSCLRAGIPIKLINGFEEDPETGRRTGKKRDSGIFYILIGPRITRPVRWPDGDYHELLSNIISQ